MCSGGLRTEEPAKSEIAKFHSSFGGDEDICRFDICDSHAAEHLLPTTTIISPTDMHTLRLLSIWKV